MRILVSLLFAVGCVLSGIMTGWNLLLIKAFTWYPERTGSSTWILDVSLYLCAVFVFIPSILIFYKPRLAGIIGFSLTLLLAFWQFGLIESVSLMFKMGITHGTQVFYLLCFLLFVYVLIVSGILTFGGWKKLMKAAD